MYIILLSLFAGVGVRVCLSSSAFCSLNPFRVHPFRVENQSRCVSPRHLQMSSRHLVGPQTTSYIQYPQNRYREAKEKKKGFLCICILYIVTGGPLFGSLYPYYFPRVIIYIVHVCVRRRRRRRLRRSIGTEYCFFDPRGCLQRKGVCDIRIYMYNNNNILCVYVRVVRICLLERGRCLL